MKVIEVIETEFVPDFYGAYSKNGGEMQNETQNNDINISEESDQINADKSYTVQIIDKLKNI